MKGLLFGGLIALSLTAPAEASTATKAKNAGDVAGGAVIFVGALAAAGALFGGAAKSVIKDEFGHLKKKNEDIPSS